MDFFYVVFVIASLLLRSSESTPFRKCTIGISPIRLNVRGCTSSPCSFPRGQNVSALVDFVVPRDTAMLVPRVKAHINMYVTSFSKNIKFSQRDACSTLTRGRCPLKKNDYVTYYFTMPIKHNELRLSVDMEVALLDPYGNVVVCTLLPAAIY